MIARMNTDAELVGVEARRPELVDLRDLDPVDELHRQDALARQLVVDDRDVISREAAHPVREPLARGTPRCGSRAP